MIVETETGSIYLFDQGRVMRLRDGETTESALRRDGDWLRLLSIPLIAVGEPMRLVLQPLGEGYATLRITSRVTAIHTGEEEGSETMKTIEELTAELEAAIKTARDLLGIDTIHATVDGVEYVVAPA